MLITLCQVILKFQSTKMISADNIFSLFTLITLFYTKFYTNLSRGLTNKLAQKFFVKIFQLFLLVKFLRLLG